MKQVTGFSMMLLSSLCVISVTARFVPVEPSSIEVENTQATMPEFTTSETIITSRPHVKNHETLFNQCKLFRTENLRGICRKIAENPVIASMAEDAVGHIKNGPDWPMPVTKSGFLTPGLLAGCPDYSKPNDNQERSLSPWSLQPNFDRHRYPQIIPEAKCLCDGCIDMTTGQETKLFASREITVKVRFLRMNNTHSFFRQCTDETCYPSDEDVAVGCHCVSPQKYRGITETKR